MKKLMFVAVAALSTAAFAHEDVSANAEGYYDVTLTTKSLAHAEKTQTVTVKKNRNEKGEDFEARCLATVQALAALPGAKLLSEPEWRGKGDTLTKVTFKYSCYDFKVDKKTGVTNMVTKVVSRSNKGLYDSNSGKVYLWDTAEKIAVKHDDADANVIVPSDKDRYGDEKDQKGYAAYEVPLAMHKQFVATDDNKAAGGFTGAEAVATDGTPLDFSGLTAFGTGTFDSKNGYLKTVAGNVAGKYPNDLKFGCYGTWKLNKDTKDYGNASVEAVLLKKGCVELINEAK